VRLKALFSRMMIPTRTPAGQDDLYEIEQLVTVEIGVVTENMEKFFSNSEVKIY
jgi:hypothetical protein